MAGVLAFSVSPLVGMQPAGAADALPPLANPIADGAVCDGAPATNPFSDLGAETAPTRETILCLVATELTNGTSPTTYSPGGTVTRRQMALFIKRLGDLLNELSTGKAALKPLPAYDGTSDFSDVAANDIGAAAIGQLAQAQIVTGFPDGTFRPKEPVSRRQMAAFVNRLQYVLTGGTPYSTNKDFFDDDEGDSGEFNLNALASVGIFQGDGAGRVNPGGLLTRRQMANILLRDAQVYYGGGYIKSPFSAGTPSFTVTPTTLATQEVAVEPSTTDDRQYTVTGLAASTTYTIQLFPAANVQGTTSVTFTESGATNTADEGSVSADVTIVNGATIAGADDDATAQAVSGQITFTVDGAAVESIVPVVYRDADSDGNLDLDASNSPVAAEPFGVGGQIRYLPPEAPIGASAFTVTSVTPERDAFVSGGVTYYLDSNDTYRYQGVAISRAQFDSILSPGDVGTANYNPDPTGVSNFDITNDDVDATAAPTVTVINSDAGPTANDARITYTRVATNSPGVTYTLQRSVVDDGIDNDCGSLDDSAGPFATVAGATQAAGSGSGQFVFSDNNVADGCYSYRIRATSPISSNTADSAGSAGTAIPGPADTTGPTSVFASMTTKAGLVGTFDAGDVVKIVFDEPMAIPGVGSKVQLRDGIGDFTIAELVAGTNASFTLNLAPEVVNAVSRPAGTVITITLTDAPTATFPGITGGLQVPATVTDRAGIVDATGNAWNLAGSSDVVVE